MKDAAQARLLLAIAAVLDGDSRETQRRSGDGLADVAGLGDPLQPARAEGFVNIASPGVPPKLGKKHRAFLPGSSRGADPSGARRGALAGLRSDHAFARGVRHLGVGRRDQSRHEGLGLLACECAAESLQQDPDAMEAFKKNFAEAKVRPELAPGTPIEV
jgi:hypothetical protein